ncbi:MAG: hypothetical protein ABIG39_00235 [Candidatus Micrarchaeota archaeon]
MRLGRSFTLSMFLSLLPCLVYAQQESVQELNILRLVALATAIIAAVMSWKWYFSTVSKPPILLWFGFGMVSELLIKWLNLTLNPEANGSSELLVAALQVVSGALFLTGLWTFLCTRWVKAKPSLAKQFLLILSVVILSLISYGVFNSQPGGQPLITYAIYVLTAFWMLLYIFITLMALYAYIRTDEMMLAWFAAGFSMMVFASWYRLLYVQTDLTQERVIVSSALPLMNSICYIIGVYLFQRAGKA